MKVKLRKLKAQRSYTFKCSLDPLEIPPISAKWDNSETLYPMVNEATFKAYCSFKHQGSKGQQEKAFRMIQSRKIVSIKTITEHNISYVKAMIKKSYGTQIRPAVILFQDSMLQKAHCSCPVGLSGLCCHVLALLLFLKHYYDTKEKLLGLTCTEQLQKWHRRSKKGSIPMVPLNEIKPKSASMKMKDDKFSITAVDPEYSYFKRNVPSIISNLKKQLKQEIPVEKHVQKVLMNSKVGKVSSVGLLLS